MQARYSPPASPRGAVVVIALICITVLLGFTALVIDVGTLYRARTELQRSADAAALAAISAFEDGGSQGAMATGAYQRAVTYAGLNAVLGTSLMLTNGTDVEVGAYDANTRIFTAGQTPFSGVRVIARRDSQSPNGPVALYFMGLFGHSTADVAATAMAYRPAMGTRFLIDNELIDTDIPAIQDLADSLGVAPDDLVNDNDGDWFIDMPPGTVLELPTGQVGDEGLFDIAHAGFPFSTSSNPSHADFLNYNEDSSSWRYDLVPKETLDPLIGVSTVSDQSVYSSYVYPSFIHVSPVYTGDVSALNPVDTPQPGTPTVNALGLRRGLLAFKIIALGSDPDGPGDVLPNLIIEIVDPATVDLATVASGTPRARLVQ